MLLLTLFRSNQPPSGLSNSYRSDLSSSSLSNLFRSDLPSNHEKTDEKPVGEFLWQDICRCIDIDDFLPKQANFCEYTQEIVTCMVITGKRHLGPDICLETPHQDTGTEEIIITI